MEDEINDDAPWLAGAEVRDAAACRLECDKQPTSCVAASELPSVLVDSGANETIRPWTRGFSDAGCKRASVITASGDRIPSQHCAPEMGSSAYNQAAITYINAEGRVQHVHCKIVNGLPFLEREEFRPIRVASSQAYRGKQTRALVATEGEADLKTSEACAMEVLNKIMWAEKVYRLSTAEKEEDAQQFQGNIWS